MSAAASPLAGDCRDWPTGSARVGSETSTQLAINPGNPRHLTATWLQDTGSNGASRGTASAVSFDAGQSWQTSSPKFTRCSGGNAAIGGDFERVTDIATVLTSDGLALQIARVASGELYTTFARSAIMIARSSNGGRNWDEMATLAIEPTPTYNLDKPVLVADADDSRYLHAAWWRTNVETGVTALRYTRTSDTGYIWTDPVQILTNVPGSSMNQGRLLSLPNGVLVYAYVDVVRLSPNPQLVGSWLRVIRSSDRGQTWSAPITVSRAESVGTTSADRTRVARDSAGLVSIAGRGNKVYLAWQDSRVEAARTTASCWRAPPMAAPPVGRRARERQRHHPGLHADGQRPPRWHRRGVVLRAGQRLCLAVLANAGCLPHRPLNDQRRRHLAQCCGGGCV